MFLLFLLFLSIVSIVTVFIHYRCYLLSFHPSFFIHHYSYPSIIISIHHPPSSLSTIVSIHHRFYFYYRSYPSLFSSIILFIHHYFHYRFYFYHHFHLPSFLFTIVSIYHHSYSLFPSTIVAIYQRFYPPLFLSIVSIHPLHPPLFPSTIVSIFTTISIHYYSHPSSLSIHHYSYLSFPSTIIPPTISFLTPRNPISTPLPYQITLKDIKIFTHRHDTIIALSSTILLPYHHSSHPPLSAIIVHFLKTYPEEERKRGEGTIR